MASAEAARDAFAERLFGMALGAYELMTVHLGDRLGLYRALAGRDGTTEAELAEAAGIDERYARSGSSSRPSPGSSRSTTRTRTRPSAATGCRTGTRRRSRTGSRSPT
jgi:hypothetical protein